MTAVNCNNFSLTEHKCSKTPEPAGSTAKACPGCGIGNSAAARFCSGCGRSFQQPQAESTSADTASCRSCGEQVVPGAKFCPQCGTSVIIPCAGCGFPAASSMVLKLRSC
ncbi:double zinc ribbon domain-containing protein [Paenibacillus graminis]|uniref:double zinc ribbon domain-containing protein n=1 Tax=Paenibacillus graminis TaxID=189425 RepID=UPI00398B7F0B